MFGKPAFRASLMLDFSLPNTAFDHTVANYQTQTGQRFSEHLAGSYTHLVAMPIKLAKILMKEYAFLVSTSSNIHLDFTSFT
jgi:hypothetical protein